MSFDSVNSFSISRCRARSGNTVALVVGATSIVAILVLLAALLLSKRPESPDGAEEEAIRFLDQIRAGQIDQAWQDTTAEFKSFTGRDRLRRMVRSNPALQHPCELVSCQLAESGPLRLLECLFQSSKYPDIKVRVLLAPTKQGRWQVERLETQG